MNPPPVEPELEKQSQKSTPLRFTYASGSRPLEGYQIKRGVGRGGFGEVYFAVSDAGKEVALKLIRRNLDVELRGVTQCLNLKHHNLVAIYDIRSDEHDGRWVVMEYVSGESLDEAIDRHPQGMSVELAMHWFAGIAAGVAYLHDHGIVHRDLKPANIFIDEAVVKIGDYGLSKFISCSRRSGQTESVGTVHYMAPEIANGCYGKEIDTYALGIILYEMLTGHVPFEGESVGEVLMKHLTAEPDLSVLDEPYKELVRSAMTKDPDTRIKSVAAMLEQLPIAKARPRFPTAAEAASPVITHIGRVPTPQAITPTNTPPVKQTKRQYARRRRQSWQQQLNQHVVAKPIRDRATELLGSMIVAAVIASMLSVLGVAIVRDTFSLELYLWMSIVATLGSWAVMIPAKLAEGRVEDQAPLRFGLLVAGALVGVIACGAAQVLLLDLPTTGEMAIRPWESISHLPASSSLREAYNAGAVPLSLPTTTAYFAFLFVIFRWWRQAEYARPDRVSIWSIAACTIGAFLLTFVWWFPQPLGAVLAGMVAFTTQLSSPWMPPSKRRELEEQGV